MNRNVTGGKKGDRPMRFIRAVLIACLSVDFTVIPCIVLLGTPVTLLAQQSGQEIGLDMTRSSESLEGPKRAPLGNVHLGLNLSYVKFRDDIADLRNSGYIGALAYGRLFRGLYLGGEVGKANNFNWFGGDDIEFLPLELNAKYAFQAGSHLVLDVGGGPSYSHVEIDDGETADQWLLGGQLFADLVFPMGGFSLAVNGKYQITEDLKDSNLALDNWRVGMAMMFAF